MNLESAFNIKDVGTLRPYMHDHYSLGGKRYSVFDQWWEVIVKYELIKLP